MKVKQFFLLALVMVVASLLLAACAPAAMGLVALPDEGRILVVLLVTAGFTWVLIQISKLIKLDLNGYAEPLAAAVSPLVITIVEHYLQMIPAQYDSFVLLAIHFLVLLAGSVGVYVGARKFGAGQTRALLK